LSYAIEIQKSNTIEVLSDHLSESDCVMATKLAIDKEYDSPRIYGTQNWTPEYRKNKIREFEQQLGLPPNKAIGFTEA